jgi:hypothetical protein
MKIAPPTPAPAIPATPEAWVDVLSGLTGLRLHALEELLAAGEASGDEIAGRVVAWARQNGSESLRARAGSAREIESALHWLGHHRLAQQGGSGRWRGRTPAVAMPIYLERGPDRAHNFTLGGSLAAQERSGDRRNQGAQVGAHAKAAEGAHLHKPAPVHAPQFFDFGDY